jgi:uncharacterized membrane protein YdcZ (DUF606 family)
VAVAAPPRTALATGAAVLTGAGIAAQSYVNVAIVVSQLGVLRLMLAVIAGQAAGGLAIGLVAPVRGETVTVAAVAGVALTFAAVLVSARDDQGSR